MPPTWAVLGFVVVAVVVVVALRPVVVHGRHRRALKHLLAHQGLHPHAREAVGKTGLLETPLLARAQASCEDVFRAEVRAAEVLVFEYVSRTRGGPHPDPVACFRPQATTLPAFELRPRRSPTDPAGLTFAGAARFSEVYALSGDDETALRALFHPEALGFFERAENQDWGLVAQGGWLGVVRWPLGRRTQRLEAKHVAGFVEDAKRVAFLLAGRDAR